MFFLDRYLFSLSCKKIRQRNVPLLTSSFNGTQGEGVKFFGRKMKIKTKKARNKNETKRVHYDFHVMYRMMTPLNGGKVA